MLSIVVCSLCDKKFEKLQSNISKTIGEITYELIRFENDKLQLDIARAYNIGLEKSKLPFMLFIHEDVLFHTSNWGEILIAYFEKNKSIGLIGVAGTKVKTKTPTSWWENDPEAWVMNLIQHYDTKRSEKIFRGFNAEDLEEVVVIDGVFIAMRKDPKIKFDERLRGFHNYDQSISLLFRDKGYRLFVTNKILIEHFSIGEKKISWSASTGKFFKLYKNYLPQSVENRKITRIQEAYSYLRLFNNFNTSNKRLAVYYFLLYFIHDPFSAQSFRMLKRWIKSFGIK